MNVAPTDDMRRGACPALSAPMMTGDGLLVRLNLAEGGITPEQLVALCGFAERHGNGIVEVTARGSFQIRGLTAASAPLLEEDVAALGLPLRDGVPVETSPLAGLDPAGIADPAPLVRALRSGIGKARLSRRLGPKVSVVVDGGDTIDLSDLLADVRLTALRRNGAVAWQLAIGGTAATAKPVSVLAEAEAAVAALSVLEAIAALGTTGRGKDLAGDTQMPFTVAEHSPMPDMIRLADSRFAISVALPFGSIQAAALAAFATAAGADEIRLAPQRSLILVCPSAQSTGAVRDAARAHGLIFEPTDPRRMIAACPGAPACASGRIATRDLARRIAAAGPISGSVHVSGCEKGCAHPTPADLVLVGTSAGIAIVRGGRAADRPASVAADVDAALAAVH